MRLDKYYTSKDIVNKCLQVLYKTLKSQSISEIIEPSAGNGAFSLNIKNCIAYDIEPEHKSIIKQDFLKLDIEYKEGRLIVGNPPYGKRNNLALQFYKKSIKICDFIAFILPISQLNNQDSLYEFDLIKSIDLGKAIYTDKNIHCCFNIYKRPKNNILNKKPKYKTSLFTLHRTNRDNFENTKHDFIICKRGSVGKIVENAGTYADEYKVVVNDKSKIDYVKNKITNYDWHNFKKHQSAPNLSKNDIYKIFLKKQS